MAKVLLSAPMRALTGGHESCEIDGGTVGEVMSGLAARYAGLKDRLLREDGTLRASFIIFLDDRDIRMLEREDTPVHADSVVRVVPAIAGG